jgi:predicted alpha/beta hydrolase family esterase
VGEVKVKNAIILHGTGGSPDSNWFQWLKSELEAKGLQVWLPALPNPDLPSLKANIDFLLTHCPFPINADTLVVGHSSGAILALILAQSNSVPLGGIVAVSVFHDNSLGWEKNAKLFDVDFDWPAIKAKSGKLLFIHSDTDPYVPLDQAKYVSNNCDAEMIVIPGQGHFNLEQSPNYRQFPRLIEIMEEKHYV